MELERNQKMIAQLIKLEKLDSMPVDVWQHAIPKIKTALNGENADLSVGSILSEENN